MNKQILFVDSAVQDYQSLIQNSPIVQIIILNNNFSGIEQITNALKNQKDIRALHILSHGSPGSVKLGAEALNNNNLENFSPQLKQWGNALTEKADILLYGCEVAKEETGQNFLKRLSEITGADIAASATPTGSTELGGDWNLEVQTGPVKTPIPFNANALSAYTSVLGFAPKVDFTTGTDPRSVSIGDFNGDDLLDLAVANNTSNNASVLLNTTASGATTPTFAPKVDFTTGTGTIAVSVGDFNSDGQIDLVTANQSSNNASIFLNTTATGAATPSFAAKADFITGTNPTSVSVGDLNGDDNLDLVTANNATHNISILFNTTVANAAIPTFAANVDLPTGTGSSFPREVSMADFNNDGKLDLAVTNSGAGNDSISVFLNTTPNGAPSPTFAPKVEFGTGSSPRGISFGDFNGDGKPDLVTSNYNSSTVSVLLNTTATGATAPTFAPKVDFTTAATPTSVSVDDFNGDGKPDLVTTNQGSASVFLNTTPNGAPTPTFAPKVDFTTGTNPKSVSVDDFNGDGKPDLAVATQDNTASILLNSTPKVTAVSATTADGSYAVGSTIAITVTFDAAVTVDTTGGTPQLQLETGTTDQFATYASGSGTNSLTFNYVVQAGDTSTDLEYLSTTALTLNGGTIKDSDTFDAILTLPTLASANSLGGSKAIVIETVAPTLTSVTSTTADGTYGTTGSINVTLNFSEAVILAGGNLTVALDSGGTVTIAPFSGTSASGTYTPATGQNSADLNSTGITLAAGATLTDAAGNTATLIIPGGQSLADSKALVVDATAPTAPTIATASGTTNNTTPTLTGTAEANSTVNILEGTTALGTATADASGNWTFTPTTALADGTYAFTATASDAAGNVSPASTALNVTIDATAPDAPIIASFSTDSGTAGDGITNNNTLTLTGTAEANSTVTLLQDATNLGTATADATGNWTLTTGTLTDGTYAFTATAADAAGNASAASAALNVTVETAAPTAALTAPNPTKDTPSTTFSVTYTDATAVDVASLDGSDIRVTGPNGYDQLATFVSASPSSNDTSITATYEITAPGGSWNVGANGTYTVAIAAGQVSDTAGNAATAADLGTFAVTLANTPPVVGVAIAPQTAALGQPFTFQVPADAFSETDPGDSLTYSATLADGSPLPAWLTLDPATGTFSGTPTTLENYNITVTATDKAGAAVSSTFDLAANYDKEQAAQTVELGLDKLEQSLDASLLAANLPVAGNNLKASAPTLLDDLSGILGSGLRSASVLNESNLQSIIQQALAAEYPDAQVTGTADASEGTVQINFTKEFDVTTALSDNLGLPALGLIANGNGNTKYAYDFSLGLGINKDYGLYIDPEKSSLKVNTNLGFDPAFTARSTMGLVPVDYILDPANPSAFVGDYSGSFKDLDNLGLADDGSRLTLKELQSQFDLPSLFDTTVNNNGTLGLKGTTNNAGDATIPTYTFDLNVGADSATGEPPSVEVNNVVLDLGTFISDFAKPIFQKINEIIKPFRPVIDALNTDTKIFSELGIADLFDKNSDGKVSVLELAASVANATFNTSFFDAITKIDEATRIVNEIANAEGTIQIKRGDFTLDDIDVTSAADLKNATISQVGVEEPTEKTYSILGFELEEREDTPADERTKVQNFFRAVDALQGIGLPILTDPKSAVGLLIGKPDVPLFTYDMPTLQLNLSVSKDFPMWGPISGLLEGEFKGRAYLKFGYDTWGLTQWKQSNWAAADSYKALDGFYVSDRANADGTGEDVPELSLEATIAAGVGVNAIIAEAYLKGGIQGTAEIDFLDSGEVNGTSDGKIRGGEIASRLATPWELFQTEGSIDIFLAAEVQTGISIPFVGKIMETVWSKNLATFNLAKFTVGPESNSFTTAWDGYMAAGEVFFDANFNGIRDASEPGTFTNVDGSSSLDVPLPQFDTNGNGTLDPLEGRIVMTDAVDVATLLPQATPLYTLPGWAAISPLTTIAAKLVQTGNSVADAQAKVSAALGLPTGVDVTKYDPLAAMAAGDAGGLAVFAAAIQVQNTIVHIAKYIDATSNSSIEAISDATIAAIATKLNAGTAVNFTDPQVILELFQAAIASVGKLDPKLNTSQLLSAASAAATVTTLGNQIVQEIADSGLSPKEAALKITQLQAVSVGEIATGLADLASGILTPEEFLAKNTREAIEQRMLDVPVSDPTVRPVIGEEVNEPYVDTLDGATPGELPEFPIPTEVGNAVSTKPTPGPDSLTGSSGGDKIFALSGNDTVIGNDGNDTVNGNQGNDTIDGGKGNDFLRGGKDADTLMGESGNDTLYGDIGTDSISGGDGNDYINGNQNEDWVDGGLGDDTVRGGKNNDTVLGGEGADVLMGDFGNDSAIGGSGNDVLFGNRGNDILDGGLGNDTVYGGKDNDTVLGSEGNDVLLGDLGNDSVIGGDGNDVIFGNRGDDLLDGGAGNDTIYGGKENDSLIGGDGADSLLGDVGNDSVDGGSGNDVIYGNTGTDTVLGGDGNDTVYGGKENDFVIGGAGDDAISGDLGIDTLTGGNGSDRFFLTSVGAGDLITDFEDGIDKLTLGVGLSFEKLAITAGTLGTDIKLASTQELLVTLNLVQPNLITAEDFTLI